MAAMNEEIISVLDKMLLDDRRVRPGKMFGYPAYYAGVKLAVCLYEGGVAVKLPADTAAELIRIDENITPFQPLGRPKMREWIQITLEDPMEYLNYREQFEQSIRFVLLLQE